MAERLLKYFKYVGDEKGIDGKVALARLTVMTTISAGTLPDSAENLYKIRVAVERITGKPAPPF
jgi:hypothetical protein